MRVDRDQGSGQGIVAQHHLFGELTSDTGGIESCLPVNRDRWRSTNTVQANVHAWPESGKNNLRLDGIEEAVWA